MTYILTLETMFVAYHYVSNTNFKDLSLSYSIIDHYGSKDMDVKFFP